MNPYTRELSILSDIVKEPRYLHGCKKLIPAAFIFQLTCNGKVELYQPSKGWQVPGPFVHSHFLLSGCVETLITDPYMQSFLLPPFKGMHSDTSTLECILYQMICMFNHVI